MIVLRVHTALRRANLLQLGWPQVDLDARKIRVADLTKSKKALEVPINDAARSALDEKVRKLLQKDNDFVSDAGKSYISDVKNPFATALKAGEGAVG